CPLQRLAGGDAAVEVPGCEPGLRNPDRLAVGVLLYIVNFPVPAVPAPVPVPVRVIVPPHLRERMYRHGVDRGERTVALHEAEPVVIDGDHPSEHRLLAHCTRGLT